MFVGVGGGGAGFGFAELACGRPHEAAGHDGQQKTFRHFYGFEGAACRAERPCGGGVRWRSGGTGRLAGESRFCGGGAAGGVDPNLSSGHDAEGAELEVGGFAGADVGEGVVGVVEGFLEEFAVELGEVGEFVAVHAGEFAEVGGFFHGAAHGLFLEGKRAGEAEAFGAENFFVEGNVVGDGGGGFFDLREGFVDGVGEGDAFGESTLGGDAVDAGDVEGDGVAFGANDAGGVGEFVAGFVAEEPGELDHARPVVEVAEGGLPVAGQAGGFGVEEKKPRVGGAVEVEYHVHNAGQCTAGGGALQSFEKGKWREKTFGGGRRGGL